MRLPQWSNLANIVVSLVATFALVWNVYEFKDSTANNQRFIESSIKQQNSAAVETIYSGYLKLALSSPHPEWAFEPYRYNSATKQKIENMRYILFASAAVNTAQNIYNLQLNANGDQETVLTVDSILRPFALPNGYIEQNVTCDELTRAFAEHLVHLIPGFRCPNGSHNTPTAPIK